MVESVPLRKVKTHPDNPRRGFIDAIVESLSVHGQYKPVVVNRRTSHIAAGNHTYKAAKRLGYRTIDVVRVTWKFNRWHHQVNYEPFKSNRLVRREGLNVSEGVDEYGMTLAKEER